MDKKKLTIPLARSGRRVKDHARSANAIHFPFTHAHVSFVHMTSDGFKKGESVSWKSSGGTVEGTVVKKVTAKTKIKGHDVAASKGNPEYIVESSKTGAMAAHKPEALKKRA